MKKFNMAIKLIKLLSDGNPHSEEECSNLLGINQIDIKKYVRIVESLGIKIYSILNNYSISSPLHFFNKVYIKSNLPFGELILVSIIDSTNQYFFKNFKCARSGDICISEYQFLGRGKLGKHWISPFGKNICLSVYWCFKKEISEITRLSIFISIIVSKVLRSFGVKVTIKWPNDVYLKNKKLAGILIETIKNKKNEINVIIGIGINVFTPEKIYLKNRISLQEVGIIIDKNELIIHLIRSLYQELNFFE